VGLGRICILTLEPTCYKYLFAPSSGLKELWNFKADANFNITSVTNTVIGVGIEFLNHGFLWETQRIYVNICITF